MREISCEPLYAAGFAAFGFVIDANARAPEWINDRSTQRHAELARLDLRAPDRDPVLAIYVARARRFPLTITRLEQHRQAAQVFMPLGAHRYLVIVAPGVDTPDWSRVTAFRTAAGQGVCLHRGCWHHGLVALADGDRFAVIEGGNYRTDAREASAPRPIALVAPDSA